MEARRVSLSGAACSTLFSTASFSSCPPPHKGMYRFSYRKLGQNIRLAHEAVAQRYKELRRSGVPHSDIPAKDVPTAYCLANPLECLLDNLCARDIQTVAEQKPDF